MVSYIKGGIQVRVFENRIPRRIFGPKRGDNGEWRRLHNEELHSLYRSPNIFRRIRYSTLRWTGHETSKEEVQNLTGDLKDRDL